MGKYAIKRIHAREILDSRGYPTVEVDVHTGSGVSRAAVPGGASRGKYEALELRDGRKRYMGRGVLKAVDNVNTVIASSLKGEDAREQGEIDKELMELDGTTNKSKMGANALLGVSAAVCRAAATEKKMPLFEYIAFLSRNKKMALPVPAVLVIEGGEHAHNSSDIQEFMVMPHKEKSFRERLRIGTEIYHTIGMILEKKGKGINVGFEGAYGPQLGSTEDVLEVVMKGIEEAGFAPKKEILLAIDSAASVFYDGGSYRLDGKKLATEELVDRYAELVKSFPFFSIEDPFAQDDWHGFVSLTERIGSKVVVIGDDLLVTSMERIRKAMDMDACNGLLLKPNQIGTVSETIEAAIFASQNKWKVMVSQRGGETCDSFLADLSVGLGTGLIKTGAPARSERLSKYNQLLRIEEQLKSKGK